MSIHAVSYVAFFSFCPSVFYFRQKNRAGGHYHHGYFSKDQPFRKREYPLICKACRSHITDIKQKITVEGSFQHTFFNPSGQVFEIGCFKRAPGCTSVGKTCDEFSWFAKMTWRVVVCSNCLTQLGWYFEGNRRHFYGLILNTLDEISR